MKYKNIELVDIMNFLNEYDNKKLPQRIVYAIMKNKVIFSKEYSIYENALNKLLLKYDAKLTRSEAGDSIIDISKEKEQAFLKECDELLNIEVDVQPYYIDESAFNYGDDANFDVLTPREIFLLINLMCNKDDEVSEERENK